jgi:hypothetical protein
MIDLARLKEGVPDEAYRPLSGDDRQVARQAARSNRNARQVHEQQLETALDDGLGQELQAYAMESSELAKVSQDSLARVQSVEQIYQNMRGGGSSYERLKKAADLWTAAFFTPLTKENVTRIAITRYVRQCMENPQTPDGRVTGGAEGLATEHAFFHWPLEFPEVFLPSPSGRAPRGEGAGFDVILGNPPFMGGLRISGNFGEPYRKWLEYAFAPFGGTADLCAAFFRRAFSLLRRGGRLGMIATNTLGQGDTRESGLAVILQQGGQIHFAQRFVKWPGQASVEVNLVALSRPPLPLGEGLGVRALPFSTAASMTSPNANPPA